MLCCNDPSHITNSEELGYAAGMGTALRELNRCLKNMIFMWKMKGITILNAMALGLIPSPADDNPADEERVMALWGPDPVHPTSAAYRELAANVAERTLDLLPEKPTQEKANENKKRKAELSEPWLEGSQAVAKRLDNRAPTRGRGSRISRGTRSPHRHCRCGSGWWHRGQRRGKRMVLLLLTWLKNKKSDDRV